MVLHRCHAPQPIHKQPARPINIMHAEMANDYRAFKAAGLLHEWRMKYVAYLPEPDQRIDTLPDRARTITRANFHELEERRLYFVKNWANLPDGGPRATRYATRACSLGRPVTPTSALKADAPRGRGAKMVAPCRGLTATLAWLARTASGTISSDARTAGKQVKNGTLCCTVRNEKMVDPGA